MARPGGLPGMRAAVALACAAAVLALVVQPAATADALAASGCSVTVGPSGVGTCYFLCTSGTAGLREYGVSGSVSGAGAVLAAAKIACGVTRGTATVGDIHLDGVHPELFATQCTASGEGVASCSASAGLVYAGVPMSGMCRASGTAGARATCYVA